MTINETRAEIIEKAETIAKALFEIEELFSEAERTIRDGAKSFDLHEPLNAEIVAESTIQVYLRDWITRDYPFSEDMGDMAWMVVGWYEAMRESEV